MSKKSDIEFHSVANIFPMMTDQELESLRHDIKTNGLREPIWLYDNKIIDGRNRYKACIAAGVKPIFRKYEGNKSDLISFVISLNIHRRHLTTSQKACLAAEIMPELEQITKQNLSKKMSSIRTGKGKIDVTGSLNTSQTASNIFGVSERYIFEAKKLLNESKQLFDQVKDGKSTLQKAFKELKQNEVSAKLQNLEATVTVELSKNDLKTIAELSTELGITEQKAKAYILKKKSIRKPKQPIKQTKIEMKEIKFRILPEVKTKLQLFAKQHNKSISELLREAINKL